MSRSGEEAGSGEGKWCEEGWDSSTVIIQNYFLHNLLLHKLSQSSQLQ